jgi:hypothetical protein
MGGDVMAQLEALYEPTGYRVRAVGSCARTGAGGLTRNLPMPADWQLARVARNCWRSQGMNAPPCRTS